MYRYLLVILGCLSLISSKVCGFYPYSCTDCGEWMIQAEWLWFNPTVDSPYFVVRPSLLTNTAIGGTGLLQTTVLEGDRVANDFNYHSGVRVIGQYSFNDFCNSIWGRWTYLKATDSTSVSQPNLLPALGPANLLLGAIASVADAKSVFHHQAAEVALSQAALNLGCFHLDLHGAVHFAWIHLKNTYNYLNLTGLPVLVTATVLSIKNDSKAWGIGPEFGATFIYCLPCNFSLRGYTSGSLLVSRMESKETANLLNTALVTVGLYDVKSDRIWRVVPAFDLRFGLNYAFDYCSCGFSIEAGYEVISYIKQLPTPRPVESLAAGLVIDSYSNIGFHGPYVAANIFF